MGDGSLHIVVFPWLAFGHMLPFLQLSKSLARRGHHIYFLSTPRNLQRLPKVSSQLSQFLEFIPLALPQVEGLPEIAEATSDLPPEEVPYLKKAFDGLEGPFSIFIKESLPKLDWIIHDFAHHWIPPIAAGVSVPCIFFSIFNAAGLVFFGPISDMGDDVYSRKTAEQFTVPPPWVPFPSKVAYRLHEARQLFVEALRSTASGLSDTYRFKMTVEPCRAVAIRSCMEVESEWLRQLPQLYKKPVLPVGLLPPPAAEKKGENDGKIMEWLDKQRSRSVVYIAFGSEAMLSTELLQEVALGLELSKLPFLWALRRPAGSSESMEILPEGFEERIRGYGIVAIGWVPQLKVLSHESVGGFLTHCGWSSIIESLQFGHPLILLPIFADQGLNAREMEEKGIGIEVERKEEDGSFTREGVAKALRLVMVEEEGEPYRNKAKEMREVFANEECQEKYVDEFIQYLVSRRNHEG